MRIPFDLLATLLALEAVRQLTPPEFEPVTTPHAVLGIFGFWFIVWLMHEWVARRAEWSTRWGSWPQGLRIVNIAEGRVYESALRHPLDVYARQAAVVQMLAVALYALFIYVYAWPAKTTHWPWWLGLDRFLSEKTCGTLGNSYFVCGLLDLGPFVVAMVLALVPKHRVLVAELGRRDGVWKWLSFEMRLTFPPLILWLILYACIDLASLVVSRQVFQADFGRPWLAVVLGGAMLVAFALVIMPWMMVRLWYARPMPEGELKDRLNALLRRSGVKARAIMEWGPPGTGFANACVLGPWAPFRYILISPGLMRMLSPEECEAVIAHEIGHVRHGHLGLLVFVVMGLSACSYLVVLALEHWDLNDPVTQGAVLMILLLGYLRLLFGAISRRCERQADLAAAELVGSPAALISALERLALLSGGIRGVPSWHHDSIARRVARLEAEGVDPAAMRRYHRSLRGMRLGLVSFSAIAVGLALGMALKDTDQKKPEGSTPSSVLEGDADARAAGRSDTSDLPQGGNEP